MNRIGIRAMLIAIGIAAGGQAGQGPEGTFPLSLHATREGMRYWYEEAGGFMSYTRLPLTDPKLDCTECHAESCDPCHETTDAAGQKQFSAEKAGRSETCLVCHERERMTLELLQQKNLRDVHAAAGMQCADCHTAAQLHGNGQDQLSMYDPDLPHPSCRDCHADSALTSHPHTVHKGKVGCSACHVPRSITCLNCHLDSVIREQKREGNYFPQLDYSVLVNHDGQVTSGTAVTMTYGGYKFVAYSPYFTHAVQAEGTACNDCHGGKGPKRALSEEPLMMSKWVNDEMIAFNSYMPLAPSKIRWPWLEKEDGRWIFSANPGHEEIQFVGYCDTLRNEQLQTLSRVKRPY